MQEVKMLTGSSLSGKHKYIHFQSHYKIDIHAKDVSCTVATEAKHIHCNGMRNSVVDHKISALQRSHPALSQEGHNCSFRRRRHQDA
jgi:hypothetical protein